MKKFNLTMVGAAAAAAAVLFAVPVSASPLAGATSNAASNAITQADGTGNVIHVQSRAEKRAKRAQRARKRAKRSNRRAKRANRRANRAERRSNRRRLRGHRGHRTKRRGYRRHSDGWWYPLAAFGVLGAIANSADRGDRHEDWCDNRYRSYRVWDNTFQPYNGPRKQCNSPFG